MDKNLIEMTDFEILKAVKEAGRGLHMRDIGRLIGTNHELGVLRRRFRDLCVNGHLYFIYGNDRYYFRTMAPRQRIQYNQKDFVNMDNRKRVQIRRRMEITRLMQMGMRQADEIVPFLDVKESTLRRDLREMEKNGEIHRCGFGTKGYGRTRHTLWAVVEPD